jgi:hypothetical protein
MTADATVASLLTAFLRLAPWHYEPGLSADDLSAYEAVARLVQSSGPAEVRRALADFQDQDPSAGIDNETRLFLLLRFVFDLPEHAPAAQRRIFWGWVNWPDPDAAGRVNLAWPLSFEGGRPVLLARFEGAEGSIHAAVEEYHDLLARFPFRNLAPPTSPPGTDNR